MERNLRTLIVEDSEVDAELLVRHLSNGGYRVDWRRVDTPEGLAIALDDKEWDIVFGDYSMPRYSGVLAMTEIRDRGLDMPFIFVSGTIGEDVAVAAMRAGAQDYIFKGNLKRLLPAVERELRESQQRRERIRAEQEVKLLETVAHAAANTSDVLAAISVMLGKVCGMTSWHLAQAWLPSDDGATIECSAAWYCRAAGLEQFRADSLSFAFAPNQDLPGRVWSSKQPLWWRGDQPTQTELRRARIMAQAGLGTAMAVPVLNNGEVIAVLEFFRRETCDEDTRLLQLVSTMAAQLAMVIQRKRAEERLHFLAHYDPLTGLSNRALFTDRLNHAMIEAERRGHLAAVMFLDLDRFKTINDSLGHGTGDLLLKEVAHRLRRCVREGDTASRLAGDEFTLVLADMNQADDAARVALKVLDTLSQPFHIAGYTLYTGCSIGISIFPVDTRSVDELLNFADIAMYRAKESGGNEYTFYTAEMTVKAQERLEVENALRRAFDHREFVLHYQPVIDLRSGHVSVVEALVRWQHPARGLVAPTEIISAAEETGLILRLGEWVLRTACEQTQDMRGAKHPELRLAVNISARQFQQPDFASSIAAILRRSGFDPSLLELEITESMLMRDVKNTLETMRRLGELGVLFAVDDFGTGYSSLSYLKHLPIGRIKIDKSFVHDIPADANDSAIVSAIISMSHNLGLDVVAEGVETAEQLEFLRAHGCDAVQGFYFTQALPYIALARWLRDKGPVLT